MDMEPFWRPYSATMAASMNWVSLERGLGLPLKEGVLGLL